MTRLALPETELSTSPAPEVWTVTPGNARPSSSAVRRAPTKLERTARPPQWPHSKSAAAFPHHLQVGAVSAALSASGPWQRGQRAGSRQAWQDNDGREPRRGTWISTGPRPSGLLAARHA